jgi:hypothetical protein
MQFESWPSTPDEFSKWIAAEIRLGPYHHSLSPVYLSIYAFPYFIGPF